MIIFGTRGITSTRSNGVFHCPRCGQQQNYTHKAVNRWFTLYFIPVLPLGTAGTYIECQSCAGTYAEAVLNYNPQAEAADTFLKLRGFLTLAMLANGHGVDEEELVAIRDFYHETTGSPLSEQDARSDAANALASKAQLSSYSRLIAPHLNFEGKVLFMRGLVRVHTVKGDVRHDMSAAMAEAAEGFQLSPNQIQTILEK